MQPLLVSGLDATSEALTDIQCAMKSAKAVLDFSSPFPQSNNAAPLLQNPASTCLTIYDVVSCLYQKKAEL